MYYPHKVAKLSDNQLNRLISGQGVRVKSGSEDVVYLSEPQIKKLVKAHQKDKGLTINFDPYQAQQHRTLKQGGGLGKQISKMAKSTKKELGKTFTKELGQDVLRGLEKTGKVAGRHVIEQGLPVGFALGSMALGDPTGMSGAAFGNIASQYASQEYEKGISGKGLFKSLHKAGIKGVKKPLISAAKTAAKVGAQAAGQAVSMYTGNPALGQKFAQMADIVAENAIDGHLKKGLKQAGSMGLKEAKRFAVEAIDDVIDSRLSGNQKRLAQNLLAGRYPSASDLVYDVSEMYTGTKGGAGIKLKKGRGRPRKHGGALYPAGYRGGALGPA